MPLRCRRADGRFTRCRGVAGLGAAHRTTAASLRRARETPLVRWQVEYLWTDGAGFMHDAAPITIKAPENAEAFDIEEMVRDVIDRRWGRKLHEVINRKRLR